MQPSKVTQPFFDFIAKRAHNEGRDAFQKGQPCQAPVHVSIYAGNWVEGWIEASFEAGAGNIQFKRAA